ncbi:TPA: dihydroorotase, partial [Candidatus Latescibacteria bacterium]|nr:dihydroorotase [Candidatus Latescibacterota bacterium]
MSGDVLVSNGKIVSIKDVIDEPAELTLDVSGKFIVPGLIDVHVHLRDPGFP